VPQIRICSKWRRRTNLLCLLGLHFKRHNHPRSTLRSRRLLYHMIHLRD
jgi:hypothetical protein